jgi:nitrate reductase delta subunit
MLWRRHRRSAPSLARGDVRTAWQVCSLLLDYPTEELVDRVPLLRNAIRELPISVSGELDAFLEEVASGDLRTLQAAYVDTFDVTRRCALHLTYYTAGDTRKRGVEIIRFKQAYRAAGVELDETELPDHLGVLLEFGAAHDLDVAWRLLCDHRVGIELLARALQERKSPWRTVIHALRATLPVLEGSDEEALARLIAEGPPSESVGLDLPGYAQDPRLNPRPEPIDLGTSIPVGAPQ